MAIKMIKIFAIYCRTQEKTKQLSWNIIFKKTCKNWKSGNKKRNWKIWLKTNEYIPLLFLKHVFEHHIMILIQANAWIVHRQPFLVELSNHSRRSFGHSFVQFLPNFEMNGLIWFRECNKKTKQKKKNVQQKKSKRMLFIFFGIRFESWKKQFWKWLINEHQLTSKNNQNWV